MKIGITGHTSGLGQALYDLLSIEHEVYGFALENGHDIGIDQHIDKIIDQIKDFDCFINNAYHNSGQTELLIKLYKKWYGLEKTIVHIGSNSILENRSSMSAEYVEQKKQQFEFIRSKRDFLHPYLIHVLPGWIDTPLIEENWFKKMNKQTVAELVIDLLKYLDKGVCVQEIYFQATP